MKIKVTRVVTTEEGVPTIYMTIDGEEAVYRLVAFRPGDRRGRYWCKSQSGFLDSHHRLQTDEADYDVGLQEVSTTVGREKLAIAAFRAAATQYQSVVFLGLGEEEVSTAAQPCAVDCSCGRKLDATDRSTDRTPDGFVTCWWCGAKHKV